MKILCLFKFIALNELYLSAALFYLIILLNIINLLKYQFQMLQLFILSAIVGLGHSKCAFQVGLDNVPVKTDREPFIIEGMTECLEYNGQLGCCDSGNDQQQSKSYVQINGVFGSDGGGCDICAINLKRFWCEYACSPNQSDFADIQDGYWPVPNPQKPDQTLMVQKLTLRVSAQSACDIFNSCSRNEFVSSVSAMSTPAGFLTFQGHNAVNDALQYMEVKFSYNKSNSIYFGDDREEASGKALDNCNRTTNQTKIHGFDYKKNCTCNHCESMCNDADGFVYTQSGVLEGFDYLFVGGTWAVAILVAVGVTALRNIKTSKLQKKKQKKQT